MRRSFTINHGYVYLTHDKISELIDLYRNHEELWNGTLEIHNRKKYRVPALIRIANMLNVECFGPKEVNIKLKYLRNRYCQERKRLIQDRNYVPTSVWYSKLDSFLRPHIKLKVKSGKLMEFDDDDIQPDEIKETIDVGVQCSNVSNKSITVKSQPPENQQESNKDQGNTSEQIKSEPLEEQAESDIDQDSSSDYSEQEESPDHQDNEDSSSLENSDSDTSSHAEVPFTHEHLEESVPKNLKSHSERLEVQESAKNNYDKFGLYVASLLRDLPRKKMLTLQPQIVNIITVAISEEMAEKTFPKK